MSRLQAPKEIVEEAYREERDANVSKRIFLVLKVKYQGVPASHVAREVHRHKSWTTPWLRRFEKDGLEGLKTMERSGRPPKSGSQQVHCGEEEGREERMRLDREGGQGDDPQGSRRGIH